PLRILLVGDYPDDPRLGSAKVYHKLRDEFRGLGHDCDVLLSPELGPRPAAARLRWLVGPVLAERAIRRAFRERGTYDVVDVASAEGSVIGARRKAGGTRGVALVSRSHGLEHLNFRRMVDDHRAGLVPKPWHRRLWYPAARMSQVAIAARLADRLLVLNDGDRDFAVARGWKRGDAVDVVPHGVSRHFLDDAPPEDAPRGAGVLFCGSWDPVKGVDYLVAAMALLAADRDPPRLTVLGPGLPEDAVLAAFPEAVRPLVTVLPRTGEDEVMQRYREHDALVMTSTYEGFGMVVVEAMGQRLPVVATTVGCAPALLAGGGGILVPPRDPAAVAGAIRRLLSDAALRRSLGSEAHERVRAMSWTATARRTLEVYEAARARPKP
ncbi:MAG TPA: glycosyltransferase family 4 protein, partial [Longimicrobium sp.]|nr:glycosyltransferase family 4 protein [Longimicrobium sp.]